ncbi:MAG TPA: LPS assembly protein LptD [Acidocella sp.]|nr:MAG: organic solvent tolerance protein [Acidocella sp. 20-58-15]HQT39427.1 LPS assembly protein LptD [Acidocella sp.]
MKGRGINVSTIPALSLVLAGLLNFAAPAHAQISALESPAPASSDNNAPVSFLADQVSYNKTSTLVTATGHVKAVQNGQTLYADKVVINRTTDEATATGHVVLLEPNGESVFADHAVLTKGMKNAVMEGVAARLAENGRLIANGATRTDAKLEDMVKVVYSACNLCISDPTAPPLWQIKATSVTRDLEHQTLEYWNAVMEIHGIPIFYIPYMTQPDPSVKRRSGFLIPSLGTNSRLGFFTEIPYFLVLDRSSDVVITPLLATKNGPSLDAKYRRDFNNGVLHIDAEGGFANDHFGNAIFSDGTFDLNENWRAGFTYNHASNPTYLDDFHILPNAAELTSNVYLEGFGAGSYARLDAETYQGLVASVAQNTLPIVAPHAQYAFVSNPDPWLNGRFSLSVDAFNVFRNVGTNTRRASLIAGYNVPFNGPFGQIWTARVSLVSATYSATHLYQQPNFSTADNVISTSRAEPYGALFMRWPFVRAAGRYGSQILEPEVQFVAAPVVGTSENYRIPNEDSLDLEYSDANLFDLNRYPGIDRLDGGERVDYALHGAWYLPQGSMIDALIGQSYRFHKDNVYLPGSGLTGNISDIVARATIIPTKYLNLTYRTRLDHNNLTPRMIDATATLGNKPFSVTGGYLYTSTNPYALYGQSTIPASYFVGRREITAGFTTAYDGWSVSANAERNIQTGRFDAINAKLGWENECSAVNMIFYRRFTSFNLDKGDTVLLIQITFKTLGNVGFSAL